MARPKGDCSGAKRITPLRSSLSATWTEPEQKLQTPSKTQRPSSSLVSGNRLALRLGRPLLLLARPGQDARQGVVALVAGVFEDLALQGVELVFAAPGLLPGRRIGDREL